MTKDALKTLIRRLIDDRIEPYKLPETELDAYVAEAEREAAERALHIKINSNQDISVTAGTATYTIADAIIFITRAKLTTGYRPLAKTTRRELDFDKYDWASDTGEPAFYFQEGREITLYPSPEINATLLLQGSRRPLSDMETPIELHESLSDWCIYRAFSDPDKDSYKPQEGELALLRFTQKFGHKRSAQHEKNMRDCSDFSPLYINPFN